MIQRATTSDDRVNVSTAPDPHELTERWFEAALDRAGVKRDRWHPAAGFRENRRTVEAVYNYYGRLYADHDYLLWAGMAAMIGPSFYAAFMDIGFLPDIARRLAADVRGHLSRRESRDAAGDLGFYEDLFLTMQKKIFEDQASMHEAYLAGGIPEIERLYAANIIDLATFAAWQEIDRGRNQPSRQALETGCRILLWREQREIIGRFYETMLDRHGWEGRVFTRLMTLAGAPSIPGARSQSQVFPLYLWAELARRTLRLRTPLARGNIARFADRWGLIQKDTLPAYLRYVTRDPAQARRDVETPVSLRAARLGILARGPALALTFVTRWRLSIGSPGAASAGDGATLTTTTGETIVFDLEAPPTAEALGLSGSESTHVWLGAGGRGMPVEIRLPGKRAFSTDADVVAVTSFDADRPLSQIMVTLSAADVDEAERRLTQHAADWGIDPADVAQWKDMAARLTGSTDRTHGTQVLGPASVGFVTIEFEIAHHARERAFHISALFTWPLAAEPREGAAAGSTD
jgi:hypothetical protein